MAGFRFLLIAAGALLLVSCIGGRQHLPTHSLSSDEGPLALQDGRLRLDSDCVFLESGMGTRWLILWPRGYSRSEEVIYRGGRAAAEIGDHVTLVGGEYDDADYDFLRRSLLDRDVPQACRGERYWLATDVHE
jgi:hypothetical protein